MSIDYRCYLVTSGTDRRTVDVAAQAAAAGAGIVQVRAKDLATAPFIELVEAVAHAVVAANPTAKVVVDDRCDVAYAARYHGAPVHGVHIGQTDIDPTVAHAMLGADAIVGWTVNTPDGVRLAQTRADELDYLGCGPFRRTPTKDVGRPPLGLDGYRTLVALTDLPVLAIGDVTPADVADLRGTGVAGVCMVRAIMDAPDPAAVVAESLRQWEKADLPTER